VTPTGLETSLAVSVALPYKLPVLDSGIFCSYIHHCLLILCVLLDNCVPFLLGELHVVTAVRGSSLADAACLLR